MDVVLSRCGGIDIGKAEVVVCVRIPGSLSGGASRG
jgi:hypothetical protein